MSSLEGHSVRIEDDWNGKLRTALGDLLKTPVEARRFEVSGANKPDGAWKVGSGTSGGLAIFSGKMGTYRQMSEAINTASEYQRNLGRIERISEAFAVTFPEGTEKEFGLYALSSASHGFKSYILKTLPELASTIQSILEKQEPVPEQPESMMLRLLRSSVDQISRAFTRESAKQLTMVLGTDSPLIASTVMTSELGKVSDAQARTAAAYILVNQVLFYHILASHPHLRLDPISVDDLDPRSLRPKYFDKVLEIDYRAVFEYDIAKHLRPADGAPALSGLVRAFDLVQASQIGNDVIGKVFHNLIPREKRKPLGAFYTNSNAGHLLASLTIDREEDLVMDPACGSGTLLVSAYDVKREIHERAGGRMDLKTHEKFVGRQLTGLDIMVFSAHLAVVNLSLQAPEYELESVRIAIEDSLHLVPGARVESSRHRLQRATRPGLRRIDAYTDDGSFKTEQGGLGGGFVVDSVDVVLMNPPFSDSDRIPPDYKAGLTDRFNTKRFMNVLHGKYSLQLPFLLLADEFIRPGGRLGAVLPLTTFTGEAFANWVDFVVDNYTVRAIVVGVGRAAFSENTQLTECLFIAEKSPPKAGSQQKFVLMATETSPTIWDSATIQKMSEAVENGLEVSIPGVCSTRLFEQARLKPSVEGLQSLSQRLHKEWGAVLDELNALLQNNTIQLGALEEKAHLSFSVDSLSSKEQEGPHGRGREYYCVSALSYFAKRESGERGRKDDRLTIVSQQSDEIVVQDSLTGATFNLPTEHLVPLLRRIAGLRTMEFSGSGDFIAKDWFRMLDKVVRHIVDSDPNLAAAAGSGDPVQVFSYRLRTRWPRRVESGRARAFLSRKVALTGPGTSLLAAYSNDNPMVAGNYWLIVAPKSSRWIERALVLWFNSSFFLAELLLHWTETHGSWGRIDKHQIVKSRVPDFSSFSETEIKMIEILFEEVSKQELPSIMEQLSSRSAPRRSIDRFFLGILAGSLGGSEGDRTLDRLTDGLRARLAEMQQGM
jgi:N-6 DNA Methylase